MHIHGKKRTKTLVVKNEEGIKAFVTLWLVATNFGLFSIKQFSMCYESWLGSFPIFNFKSCSFSLKIRHWAFSTSLKTTNSYHLCSAYNV
jgi:hypothetical protein